MPRATRTPKLPANQLVAKVNAAIQSGQYRIMPHARLRCSERDVAAPDIETALCQGHTVPSRDRYDLAHTDWSYCFEGPSVDGDPLRIVVAIAGWMLVVTVIRLGDDKED